MTGADRRLLGEAFFWLALARVATLVPIPVDNQSADS
jgi:hypothetical protein